MNVDNDSLHKIGTFRRNYTSIVSTGRDKEGRQPFEPLLSTDDQLMSMKNE